MSLGKRIKEIRKAQNPKMTQESFGDLLGVGRDAITSYELDRVEPKGAFIQLLCVKFHVNEEWLRTGKGERFDKQSQKTLLEQVVKEYGLTTPLQQKAMELFLNSSEENRERTLQAVRNFSRMLDELDETTEEAFNEYSAEEQEIIRKYRALSEQAQERIKAQLNLEYEQTKSFGEELFDGAGEN